MLQDAARLGHASHNLLAFSPPLPPEGISISFTKRSLTSLRCFSVLSSGPSKPFACVFSIPQARGEGLCFTEEETEVQRGLLSQASPWRAGRQVLVHSLQPAECRSHLPHGTLGPFHPPWGEGLTVPSSQLPEKLGHTHLPLLCATCHMGKCSRVGRRHNHRCIQLLPSVWFKANVQ